MKCVSYTRTIPWKNHKGELTIADQNQRIAEYLAEHKELNLQKRYSDRKNAENAGAAFDKMIDDGVEQKFDCIIVASMYYCGPDFPAARQAIKETLYETGVNLIVLEEGLDTRTASRKEVEDYFEEKRCEMHAEIMFAWRKKQGAGFRLTNSVPFGYIRRNGESNMVKDEEVAPYLSEAFSRYASGQKMGDIAKWLNEQNVEPPMKHKKRIQGKPYEGEPDLWTSDNLRGLFRNPTYTGATANGSHQIIAENCHEPYMTKEQFYALPCNMRQGENKKSTRKKYKKPNPLAKRTICTCGRPLYWHKDKKTGEELFYCSYCRAHKENGKELKAPAASVYKKVIDAMERERREEEKMYSAIQQGAGRKAIEAVRADSSMQMKTILAELNMEQFRRVPLYECYMADEITEEQYHAEVLDYEEAHRKLNEQLTAIMENTTVWERALSLRNPWIQQMEQYKTPEALDRNFVKKYIDNESMETQIALVQDFINRSSELNYVDTYFDNGFTGTNFDRPGFQKMMDGVRSGEIDTIIVKDLSRFGRDYIGVGEYMEQIFPLLGVRLISVNDNYDSNNYNGATLGMDLVVSNLVNTMYCRDAGKKLRTANRVKWRKGISTASSAPFGYQFDPNKKGSYIIDPPAAKIVRRIFDLAILGLRTREIAMTLNDENAPVPSVYNREHKAYGKETTYTIAPVILWDSTRVWKILTAYVYTGAMVLGKSQRLISGKSISRTVPKGQQYITEGTHEAIVSREEFEKAQLVINNRNKVVMGSVDFPLKGKVRCGNCRRAMGYDYKQASPIFWCREGQELIGQTKCSSEIFQANDIENAVFQALKKELSLLGSLYGDIKKEEQSLKEASRKASRRKTSMEQELKNLKGEKMRMYEEYAAGTLSLDNYKNKKQEYDRKIAEVQDKIEQSKAEEAAQSVVSGTVRAAAEQAENFLHGTRLTASMVSAFIENVYVHEGGRIVVQFKYEQSIQDAVRALHTD